MKSYIKVSIVEDGKWLKGTLKGIKGLPPTEELDKAWKDFIGALSEYRRGNGTVLPFFKDSEDAPVFQIKTRWTD